MAVKADEIVIVQHVGEAAIIVAGEVMLPGETRPVAAYLVDEAQKYHPYDLEIIGKEKKPAKGNDEGKDSGKETGQDKVKNVVDKIKGAFSAEGNDEKPPEGDDGNQPE